MHQTLSTPATTLSTLEWRIVCERHCNMLLEGREDATDAALLLLRPHLFGIVYWKQRTAPLDLPRRHVRTLILENVASLRAADQTELLTWLAGTDQRIQVVSTTTYPLFPFVTQGIFDERLYYRLNTVKLHID